MSPLDFRVVAAVPHSSQCSSGESCLPLLVDPGVPWPVYRTPNPSSISSRPFSASFPISVLLFVSKLSVGCDII